MIWLSAGETQMLLAGITFGMALGEVIRWANKKKYGDD